MKKKWGLTSLALVLVMLFLMVPTAQAAMYHYKARVTDEQANGVATGCQVHIYDAGTSTLATIASDKYGTSKTNPITTTQFATDKGVDFWGASTTYDVLVTSNTGEQWFYRSWGYQDSKIIVLDKRATGLKTLVVPFALGTGATNTGIQLPVGAVVMDALVDVVNTYPDGTMDMGLRTNEAYFLTNVPVGYAGVHKGATGNAIYYGTSLYGADQSGSNIKVPYRVATGGTPAEITYGDDVLAGNTASGYLYLFYTHSR